MHQGTESILGQHYHMDLTKSSLESLINICAHRKTNTRYHQIITFAPNLVCTTQNQSRGLSARLLTDDTSPVSGNPEILYEFKPDTVNQTVLIIIYSLQYSMYSHLLHHSSTICQKLIYVIFHVSDHGINLGYWDVNNWRLWNQQVFVPYFLVHSFP